MAATRPHALTSEDQLKQARALAEWLKAPLPQGCGELDAQPIALRLGRAWYVGAEYQHEVPQSARSGEDGYIERVYMSLFELRICVLGKPHVKDSQGRTPWISCRYVWRDEDDNSEWYIATSMDVEFTRDLVTSGRSHINPEWEKYHPFGSWFALHKLERQTHPFSYNQFANRTRVSMEIVDLLKASE